MIISVLFGVFVWLLISYILLGSFSGIPDWLSEIEFARKLFNAKPNEVWDSFWIFNSLLTAIAVVFTYKTYLLQRNQTSKFESNALRLDFLNQVPLIQNRIWLLSKDNLNWYEKLNLDCRSILNSTDFWSIANHLVQTDNQNWSVVKQLATLLMMLSKTNTLDEESQISLIQYLSSNFSIQIRAHVIIWISEIIKPIEYPKWIGSWINKSEFSQVIDSYCRVEKKDHFNKLLSRLD